MKNDSTEHQINGLRGFLAQGKGDLISAIYMRLADLFASIGEFKQAIEVIKTGIAKVTEQKYKQELDEMLR